MTFTTSTKRNGAVVTHVMYEFMVLIADGEWHDLPDANVRTVKALFRRDWIAKSVSIATGRTEYKLTSRGKEALNSIDHGVYRLDGMCPRCGEHPKHCTPSGKLSKYCEDCLREIGRVSYHRYNKSRAGRLCQCGKPLHVTASGHVHAYCHECLNARQRVYRPRYEKRRIAKIKGGETIMCRKCGEVPIYHTENSVSPYCLKCLENKHRKAKLKRSLKKSQPQAKG